MNKNIKSSKAKKAQERLLAIRHGHAALRRLIELCQKEWGARARVWRDMTRMRGRPCVQQQLHFWLAPKAKDWKSPSFANGIILLLIQEEMCGPDKPLVPLPQGAVSKTNGPEIHAAVEFGYRCCEKGMNIQTALSELDKIQK